MKLKTRKIGIIGVGPRGGYALEQYILQLAMSDSMRNIHITLFESTGNFGNGQVYSKDQNSANWINLCERLLDLKVRKRIQTDNLSIEPFPSYHDWIHANVEELRSIKDSYPPRAKLGTYLSKRFSSLATPLLNSSLITLSEERVINMDLIENQRIKIETNQKTYLDFDEVLLTIGHQPTFLSDQIEEWEYFTIQHKNLHLFTNAYPIATYLNHEQINSDSNIGIRGFGLTMIDIVRAFSNKYGVYTIVNDTTQECRYETSTNLKDFLFPFSLDGLPPAPKPLNAEVDSWFQPSSIQLKEFERIIADPKVQSNANSSAFLIQAIVPIISDIYINLHNKKTELDMNKATIQRLCLQWFDDRDLEHPLFIPTSKSAEYTMRAHVGMATGTAPISLDYCIGQVWRHCQPTIYKSLSYSQCSDEVIAEIIKLDESTKRYSYGPPVESIQQLLALINADVLNLNFVQDPHISYTEEGWLLDNGKVNITIDVMIDSVLDSPKIKAVNSLLVTHMLNNDLINVVHDDLGVETNENGYLVTSDEEKVLPIALLGRLAKGTVIGVDAILECFGERPQAWAKAAAEYHHKWLQENNY